MISLPRLTHLLRFVQGILKQRLIKRAVLARSAVLDSVKSPANVVGRRTYSRRRGSVCPMDEGADYNVAIELHPN